MVGVSRLKPVHARVLVDDARVLVDDARVLVDDARVLVDVWLNEYEC